MTLNDAENANKAFKRGRHHSAESTSSSAPSPARPKLLPPLDEGWTTVRRAQRAKKKETPSKVESAAVEVKPKINIPGLNYKANSQKAKARRSAKT